MVNRALERESRIMKTDDTGSDQTEQLLGRLKLIAECVSALFPGICEVVVHDLRQPDSSIVAIHNGHISGREVGGPIVGGPVDDEGLAALLEGIERDSKIVDYETRSIRGRKLKSATAIFTSDGGEPVASLCMNLDLTGFTTIRDMAAMIVQDGREEEAADRKTVDPMVLIQNMIQQVISEMGIPVNLMKKADKLRAVEQMHDRGVFLIKGAVDLVANELGVSPFTVYGYISEIKNGRAQEEG